MLVGSAAAEYVGNADFGKRHRTTMASPISKTSRKAISLDAFGRDLARRCEVAGMPAPPRNTGLRRIESKRALLAALKDTGTTW